MLPNSKTLTNLRSALEWNMMVLITLERLHCNMEQFAVIASFYLHHLLIIFVTQNSYVKYCTVIKF